jgi:predicted  nucleic acid-binding Zn-ribbon protein
MHESNLDAAAALVADKRKNVSDIRAAIAAQEKVIAAGEQRRQAHTLQAALGDVAAKDALAKLLHEDIAAERILADLRLSLPQAERELANAEQAQKSAEAEWRRFEVVRLARDRVEAAGAIDQAFADFSAAWQRYSDLGRELYSVSEDNPNQIYLAEHLDGLLRLAYALPHQPFFDLRHRHSFAQIGGGAPLAVSEAAFWRLPPAEEVRAA